jgi:Na+/melibiose symporter-like transporter
MYSLIQPALLKFLSPKFLYIITQFLAGGCFVSVLFLQPWPAASIALLVVVAMNFAAFNSIPFALVSKITAGANGGLYLGS